MRVVSILCLFQSALAADFDHSHALWKKITKQYVVTRGSHSWVDYRLLMADPGDLEAYLKRLEGVSLEDWARFSEPQKLAFLINAYNAQTLKLVIAHYPIRSIKNIGKPWGSPWKKQFFTLLGMERSLDELEHELLLKEFNEPRIHLALVRAAKGCPALMAYTDTRLEEELREVSTRFLQDKARNRYDSEKRILLLSRIFEWYGDDFKKTYGSVKDFVAPLMTVSHTLRDRIRSDETVIEYLDYDWSLNEKLNRNRRRKS